MSCLMAPAYCNARSVSDQETVRKLEEGNRGYDKIIEVLDKEVDKLSKKPLNLKDVRKLFKKSKLAVGLETVVLCELPECLQVEPKGILKDFYVKKEVYVRKDIKDLSDDRKDPSDE